MKHLTGLCELPLYEIQRLLDLAAVFKKELRTKAPAFAPTLLSKKIALAFFENSTRTRFSFEIAAKHLGASTLNFTASSSSVSKGETLGDTIKNLEAMQVDAFVIRHPSSGAADLITGITSKSVINAGDGSHEHPTQALLDMFTLKEHFGSLEGLNVFILGDILHSRVARSNIFGMLTLGANVALCSPSTLLPPGTSDLGIRIFTDLDQAIQWADAAIVLRLQLERATGGYLPSLGEYAVHFGLTDERLERIRKHLLVLHPGPINREIEISSRVADRMQPPGFSSSLLLQQVTNGIAVRMAVLQTLLAE
ncbi:aspartate carbamoyltransferase catalytic subunit [Chlorobium phaeobacteroides]|uniref:Aspartate carbamoyltransferase catalytic subunit n=1 Tax=Chlorobium phaeobacteroides (strain DSM 266 / SMG 266 / 2430) TaxID=290317 RepID=PYRB_CHLPD|nr:aspartate carbamoyltransferase catalytic subunit [Chlorobium phaeobacteroides]A1BEE6.1 RecName: Full=Aspartate carbamoyltransferase catalytic subunit; AltName: Full=Aspartate transcarbamylase; Short=ATCase [Chlorobium phaeobacteroides DSM 266]ABL64773.1 aspartate carbamoyltransferase [Chlorobium phaeobacteroides DSM 266]MBV5319391.1 aspartate carbamoyltransferase catalytic subunit [Chlorobium phaeobacteroides]